MTMSALHLGCQLNITSAHLNSHQCWHRTSQKRSGHVCDSVTGDAFVSSNTVWVSDRVGEKSQQTALAMTEISLRMLSYCLSVSVVRAVLTKLEVSSFQTKTVLTTACGGVFPVAEIEEHCRQEASGCRTEEFAPFLQRSASTLARCTSHGSFCSSQGHSGGASMAV